MCIADARQKPQRTVKCCCESDCSWQTSLIRLRLDREKRTPVLQHHPTPVQHYVIFMRPSI